MTAEKWACRLCTRPNTEVTCGYCGHPRSEQWRLPPLPGEHSAVRAGRTARVRSYVLAPAEGGTAVPAATTATTATTTPTAETGKN